MFPIASRVRRILLTASLCVASGTLCDASRAADASKPAIDKPNVVLLFADDLGYADLHCFGGQTMVTPNLDAMAREGRRMTSFYVAQGVCSASRCGLLTGCYNVRVGILGALGPGAKVCLNPEEQTIAEILKPRGYHTAIFGKWHLGDRGVGLPTNHGFDEYFGLPYSNDMWPYHPTARNFPPLPLIENEKVINANVTAEDQRYLTRWNTEHAIDFMQRHQKEPFFLYVPYNMPHVPIFASEKFEGSTGKGLYHDVIAEIDWSVGEIRKFLRDSGLDERTLVIFTSDNGPWLSYGNHAGSAGPLREGKGTAWEGGVREPTIACWPGQIPAGTESNQLASTIDILPTLAHLAGAKLPERKIDGLNIWPLLSGDEKQTSPHEVFTYYWGRELHAIRSGPWKLHFPHQYRSLVEPGKDGQPGPYKTLKCGLELYNVEEDVGEKTDVADQHPDVVERLKKLADQARSDLGDALTKTQGSGLRPAGKLP
ncbi:MAG: sulfatase family protein [Aureliella sp.]|jgi:arylsulfatase A-like enzyme